MLNISVILCVKIKDFQFPQDSAIRVKSKTNLCTLFLLKTFYKNINLFSSFSYIYCFLTTQGIWSGQIYTCPGSTYFNPVTLYCGVNRPTGC